VETGAIGPKTVESEFDGAQIKVGSSRRWLVIRRIAHAVRSVKQCDSSASKNMLSMGTNTSTDGSLVLPLGDSDSGMIRKRIM
jgi:hypothetical protein